MILVCPHLECAAVAIRAKGQRSDCGRATKLITVLLNCMKREISMVKYIDYALQEKQGRYDWDRTHGLYNI